MKVENGDQRSEKLLQSRGLSPPDADSSSRSETLHSGLFLLPSLATSSSHSPGSARARDGHLAIVQRQAWCSGSSLRKHLPSLTMLLGTPLPDQDCP